MNQLKNLKVKWRNSKDFIIISKKRTFGVLYWFDKDKGRLIKIKDCPLK